MDWIAFFQSNNIHYITSGPNTARDHISTHCVWCGASDESEHLSVSLSGKGFRCWRQPQHSGRNPAKLIQALLNCSWEQANVIAGHEKSLPNDFMQKVKSSLLKQVVETKKNKLELPIEFKQFTILPSGRIYVDYLRSRNFTDENIFVDTKKYGIYYASQGLYKGRVIFSIIQSYKLVGWTGRTIFPSEQVRYKTLTHDLEKAKERGEFPAPNPISYYLLFHDRLMSSNANTIVLCEGPFDAWRVNLLGESLGVVATCFFTSMLSEQQLNLLHEILPKFENKYLLLDEGTFSKAARIRSDLVALDVIVKRLSQGVKDPGELRSTKQLKEMLAIV